MKTILRIFMTVMVFLLTATKPNAQETRDYTINVDGRQDWTVYTGAEYQFWDEFTIIGASGITWVRVVEGTAIQPVWETTSNILYDGPPISQYTVKCVKGLPPCEGCYWKGTANIALVAIGKGSLTIRLKKLWPNPPFPVEGEYLDKYDGTFASQIGSITANPASVQPGNTTNIKVTIPPKMSRLINGITLIFGPPNSNTTTVTRPYEQSGTYEFAYTVPALNGPSNFRIRFEAYSVNLNSFGQPYLVTSGETFLNLSSVLSVEMILQDKSVPNGSSNSWNNDRPRAVSARILNGLGPFRSRWIVNGQEVETPPEQVPFSTVRTLLNQNVLSNAATVTFEVTDANSNVASGTFFVGVDTNLSFQFNVQGVKAENGSTIKWREESSKLVTINPIYGGKMPLKSRWLINNIEKASLTLANRFDQFLDQNALSSARSVTFEVTDANGIKSSGTIYIGNPGNAADTIKTPAGPVGPAPVPPPLTGDPSKTPNADIDWNNKPWMNEKVQACIKEYLENIVLFMENAIRKWENTGLPESRQNALFTSIDDWGRLLNQYITSTGRVDGIWDNPSHYVWSAYNKPSSAQRYGRTVEYYVKYECRMPESPAGGIDNAIDDLLNGGENQKWDKQKVKAAQSNLNNLLDLARSLYNKFLVNYYKFKKEINDQNSNPLENEIIALCIATADGQLNEHTINKDSLEVTGNALISQSATNKDINMFDIIRVMSEVQVQSDDMNKKNGEMRNLLAARGGDIDQIITNGQHLIAQGNVNPEFAQDGGVNVEFAGDGIDNIGNGLQDFLYGNVRRGNVLIVIWDAGNIMDDIFEVSISGRGSMGTTPPGGRRNFDITLNPGTYSLTIRGVYTDPNSPPCTYGIEVYDQDNLILQEALISIEEKQEATYSITIR